MPPTGSPDCRRAGTSVRRCMPHGVRHPDGETDRRSRRRGQAAGTPARTIRMPPVSSIWNPGPEMGTSPGSSSEPEPGRRPCPGPPRRNRPPRPRPPGRRRMRPPGASIFLFRHHAERRGRSGKTHAYPICTPTLFGAASEVASQIGHSVAPAIRHVTIRCECSGRHPAPRTT